MSRVNKHKSILFALLFACTFCADLSAASNWFRLSTLNETRESIAKKQHMKKIKAEKIKAEKQKIEAEKRKIETEKQEIEVEKRKIEKIKAEKRKESFDGFKKGVAAVGHNILWYLPNRICDLVDCFTGEIGVGEIGIDLKLTRYAEFGTGIGTAYMTGWSINRQNGLYMQRSYYANFLQLSASDTVRKTICGDYIPTYGSNSGTVDIENMLKQNAEDPFAIGIKAGCYINFRFELHPVEIADFIAGIFFIDFKGDDQ